MSELEVQRIIGRLEQMTITTAKQVEDSRQEMQALRADVAEIRKTLDEARGGWKLIVFLGGGAAAFGAAITAFLKANFP